MGEGLDVKQPFDWIFELIVGDDNRGVAEARWWRGDFTDKMVPVMTGVVPLGRYIDGDAPVAEHNDDHIASSLTSVTIAALGHDAPNDNKRRKTGSQGAGHQLVTED